MRVKKLGATVAVALLLATSACGSSRPSEGELSKAFQKGMKTSGQVQKLTKKQADCAAKVFANSKISDKTLRELAKGNGDYKDEPKSDDKALAAMVTQLQKCT